MGWFLALALNSSTIKFEKFVFNLGDDCLKGVDAHVSKVFLDQI